MSIFALSRKKLSRRCWRPRISLTPETRPAIRPPQGGRFLLCESIIRHKQATNKKILAAGHQYHLSSSAFCFTFVGKCCPTFPARSQQIHCSSNTPPPRAPETRSDKVESTATTKKQILKPASDIAVDLNASAAAETIQAERNTDASISSNAISVQDTAITETEIQVNLLTTPPTESTTGMNFV